ncbi:hypothetical protein Tco_0390560 [Tanacetum coccineum]
MSSYNHLVAAVLWRSFNWLESVLRSSVGSEDESVYDSNPYSYNDTPNFFNKPPQHQYETYSCEFYGGNPHPSFDCQIGNTPVFDQGSPVLINDCQAGNMPFYDQDPCYDQNFSDDQPPFYSSYQQQQFDCCEVCGGPHYSSDCQTRNQFVYEPNPVIIIPPSHPAYTPSIPFLATMKPIDTLLMGDEVISTIPARETDEFIKFSVDDFVLILRESEVTS